MSAPDAATSSSTPSAPTPAAALPQPKAQATPLTVAELHALFLDPDVHVGVDYIVVDVRRTDIEEGEPQDRGLHPAAINLPAQTFLHTLPVTYRLLNRIPKVIFHCNRSTGRGPRCAGWYQDYLDEEGCTSSKSYVLVGGIKQWRETYPDLVVRI